MSKEYVKFTTYSDIEDLKRLDFIVNSIKALNNPEAKILDIGCGNGNISLALGSIGYHVTGVDIDDRIRLPNKFDSIFVACTSISANLFISIVAKYS